MDDWSGNTIGLRNQTYKPIPVFQSSRGGMVFDNSTYRLRADVGETRPDQMRLTQQGPIFDYYFWSCPPEQALESYTDLTGKPVLPPKWAFEPWMGRTGRGWNAGPLHNMVAEEESVVNRFETLDIPHSAIYAEGSGNADSPALNQFMSHRGIRVLSWFYPVISETRQAELMPELKPAELPCLHATDEKAARQLGYVDFTNPNALELFRRWWQHRLDVGVAGSMVDFGDRVPEDAVFYDGRKGDEMHNFYAYDYHRTCAEVFREKRGDDFILFGRAAAPGTQKWVAQFGGDHRANFVGLQAVLTGVLNLSTCGFSTWGSDLGGFLGWPEPQVYMRWTQFGCFSPLMRCHGRTPREPWNYGDAAVANYKYFTWVRENLLNYIYNSAIHAHETGIPMVRSMAVAYPDDISLAAVADQYMFGSDLLVAPVITENNSRIIRFPAGQWTSLWDGETVSGPTNVNVSVPLNKTPVYLKPGALMPIQLDSALELGASMTPGRVNVLLVTPPTETETVSLPNIRGRSASVSLSPSQGGFSATLKNLPETDCVLVYGSAVTAVKINGENLPNLPGAKFDSMPRGWCADPAMNRVVIRLPKDQNEPRGSAVEIQITIQKKNTNK
jgi:alpha-glucosidase (family GH31 glycosyl hydrolase)